MEPEMSLQNSQYWLLNITFSQMNPFNSLISSFFKNHFITIHVPQRLWGPSSLLSIGYQGLFLWGWSGRGVKLTTYLYLIPRSKDEWRYISTFPIRRHGVVLC
jgi:hypothetical protein